MHMPCLIAWQPVKADYVLMCAGHLQISSAAISTCVVISYVPFKAIHCDCTQHRTQTLPLANFII